MPVPKLYTSGTLNAIKSEEEDDSVDPAIRQAIVKDPLLPFLRTGDNPVQWIQLLHALDQPDLPGWPLMTPIKVQMQKCEKCSREFCSTINYRRHIRVHRRSLNVKKESDKHRDLLAAFWDKLSLYEAMKVVSFNDVSLKEIPGSSIIVALASFLHQPGVWTLPQFYVNAGSTLFDIIQDMPSRLPISSQELFNILDDASERTFLCAGTAESVQNYLFGGEAAKVNLELKNLIACTSFLFEQKLVKAWLADKDEEALRCQKLLVEEEEAAQKRQAEILERKKQKKLRRKEQKVKEQIHGYKGDLNAVTVSAADGPVLLEASELSSPSDSCSNSEDMPTNLDSGLETMHFQDEESEKDIEAQIDSTEFINEGHTHSNEAHIVDENDYRDLATNKWQVSKSQRVTHNGFHGCQNLQILKPKHIEKVGPSNDGISLTGNKVWTEKHKTGSDEKRLKPSLLPKEETKYQVVIGSIPIAVICSAQQKKYYSNVAQDTCGSTEADVLQKNASEKLVEADTVSCGESKGISPVKKGDEDSEDIVLLEKFNNQIISTGKACANGKLYHVLSDGNDVQGNLRFNSIAAKEFLMRRWKEAISGDHVKLVYSSVCEPPDVQRDISVASTA